MKILYGTGNPAKLQGMRRRLAGLDLEIWGLWDVQGEVPEVEEQGATPLENARQKAHAYYEALGVPVFSCDSGLYLEGVPDELQPGVHVRTVGGKYLTDDEMRAYYGGLAKRYGNLKARYQHAICLVLDGNHTYESMDESLSGSPFLITSVPFSGIRQKGFPLDSLSVDIKTGKYFYELGEGAIDKVDGEDGFLKFFRELPFWAGDYRV